MVEHSSARVLAATLQKTEELAASAFEARRAVRTAVVALAMSIADRLAGTSRGEDRMVRKRTAPPIR